MDSPIENIDPAWWGSALGAESRASYEAPEYMSLRFERRAKDTDLGGLERFVIETLAEATSAMLESGDLNEPFVPAVQCGGQRSVIPSDLSPEKHALLGKIAPLVDRPDLKARICDVIWTYGDRSDREFLHAAIDSYTQAPLDVEHWFVVSRAAWHRAISLLERRGKAETSRLEKIDRELYDRLLNGAVSDDFLVASLSELLRSRRKKALFSAERIYSHLDFLANEAKVGCPSLSRVLWREAISWVGPRNSNFCNSARTQIASTYVAEADEQNEALARVYQLEKAISILVELPRIYRREFDIEEQIASLRKRLDRDRGLALEQMETLSTRPVDASNLVHQALSKVTGHADRFSALAALVEIAGPMDKASTRVAAEKLVTGSISSILRTETYSRDGRKVAVFPGNEPDSKKSHSHEDAVWNQMVRMVTMQAELTARAVIQPAHDVVTFEHHYDRAYLVSLCVESPAVPEGQANLWGAGLNMGLAGDYGPAVAILMPLLENAVRTWLKRNSVYTLYVGNDRVEEEKSLGPLLDMNETAELFGNGMVMEFKALLVDQQGMNLRNEVAHGLLDDPAAWSYQAMHAWWHALRFALLPLVHMHRQEGHRP